MSRTSSEHLALLDDCWALEVAHNDHRPLWDGDVDQLERWPSTSVAATTRAREELLAGRAAALDAVGDAADLAPSLRTVADAMLLLADTKDVEAELTHAHPALGLHSFLFWAVNDLPLRTAAHGQRYLDKLERFPDCIDELCQRLAVAAEAGRAPITRHSTASVERLGAHLDTAVDEDPLLAQAPPTDLGATEAAAWRDDVADAVVAHVRPALGRLRATLREASVPAGRSDDACGLVHVPDGEATYARLVEAYTWEGVTPDQVHAIGLEQVERLAEEYRELGREVFGTAELAEVFAHLRDDESLAFTNAADVVRTAEELHARAEAAAPAYFATTPTSPCRVRATDEGSLAFYSPPAADGSRPGVFFLNTATPEVWGPNLAATVFHEGVPGHHFQSALALEDTGLHDLHRRLFLPAFGEGWGLYAERLADEMGLYVDGVQRLGMLATDSLRACRLVVDTGMHARGWGRQRAIDWMLDNSPLQATEVIAEIDRYIGMPGQATSYMMGRIAIEQLRDEAAERLGEDFDLRDFHDVVLSRGMVSIPALRATVATWLGRAGV